ncbi:DUF1569 domain-containing protein [Pedobacter frigoris]|uniref:DUF1569 domain-containing protein n=1 Tax=Pedobacter frigoris TaxID=2571272 RepID=A0A4U1CK73_9SPHI|nr:DUF1569 domain-containing protein [Pedobacter frigoris]TKC05819.1 DUF1569 domain-containing protein [Pedobacter frigoris]
MNSLYNQEDVKEILKRIEKLTPNAQRQWGKMNVSQMLAHLNISLETPLGINFPKRAFLGRIIGGIVKIGHLSKKPLPKNAPTDPNYIIRDNPNFEKEKSRAIELINIFYENGASKCSRHPHSFFGKLTPQQWSVLQWKHFDHHLRQFGV